MTKIRTKLLIVGSGVSGIIAHHILSQYDPCMITAAGPSVSALGSHNAVMRFRDTQIADLLGLHCKEITIQKMIYMNGSLTTHASITANNMYSYKTTNQISNKSIQDLGFSKRYITSDPISPPKNAHYDLILDKITGKTAIFKSLDGKCACEVGYDAAISTVPAKFLVRATANKSSAEFKTSDIFVKKIYLDNLNSSVHQTIYLPEPMYDSYRATLQDNLIMIESIHKPPKESEVNIILELFGLQDYLSKNSVSPLIMSNHRQKNGKMIMINNAERKKIIYDITQEHNIFSLGRYAIWKPLRIDQIYSDARKIKQMLSSLNSEDYHYGINKERMLSES